MRNAARNDHRRVIGLAAISQGIVIEILLGTLIIGSVSTMVLYNIRRRQLEGTELFKIKVYQSLL